ncbi:MAG: hypothetical protein ACR2PK_19290 [Acidimicrobiales bacterium]
MDPETPGEPGNDPVEHTGSELEPTAKAELSRLDPDDLPATRLQAAAPSKPARGLAFASIVVGGVCGGLIGYAFTDLQCEDGCTGWAGLSGVLGALIGAIGVAIVAVLVLRAMDEWESVKDQDPGEHPARRRPS